MSTTTNSNSNSNIQNRLNNFGMRSQLKRASSMKQKRGSKLYSSGGSASSTSSMGKRSVSFGEASQCLLVDCTANLEHKNQIWYSEKELQKLRKREILQNKECQQKLQDETPVGPKKRISALPNMLGSNSKPSLAVSIETLQDDVTWRGLEYIQQDKDRTEQIRFYVRTVVQEHQDEATATELKRIAKALSKKERVKAYNLGLQDELQVLGDSFSTLSNTGNKEAINKRGMLVKTFSGSSWKKRSDSFLRKKSAWPSSRAPANDNLDSNSSHF